MQQRCEQRTGVQPHNESSPTRTLQRIRSLVSRSTSFRHRIRRAATDEPVKPAVAIPLRPQATPATTTGRLDDEAASTPPQFSRFRDFPAEVRIKIWEMALVPSVIRCKRLKWPSHCFTRLGTPPTLLTVSREAREVAMLYGEYILISTFTSQLHFSLKYDYLWLDVGWREVPPPNLPWQPPFPVLPDEEFISVLPPDLMGLRNIMVHPNWNEYRAGPTAALYRLPRLESILVAADEKSIGIQSTLMLNTMRDLKTYYASTASTPLGSEGPKPKTPRIAVGCLGWTGAERQKMYHSSEAERELVAVFEDYAAMKDHLKLLREEERKFTQEHFERPKPSFILKLQRAKDMLENGQRLEPKEEVEERVRKSRDMADDDPQPPPYIGVPESDPLCRVPPRGAPP